MSDKKQRKPSDLEKAIDEKISKTGGFKKKIFTFSHKEMETIRTVTIIEQFAKELAEKYRSEIVAQALVRVDLPAALVGDSIYDTSTGEFVVYIPESKEETHEPIIQK